MTRKRSSTIFASAFNVYTVVRPIGSGGSGTVHEVTDVDGKTYALKVIDLARSTSQKRKRFKNETMFCLSNKHKNIVTVIDHGRGPSGDPFYVMPLYPVTLQKVISEGISPSDVIPIFSQVLNGVDAAHLKKVIHRDLKPPNILGDSKKENFVVADFGIAAFEEEDLYTAVETKPGERLANFLYAAPEQCVRGEGVTFKADIYALGLILNEMFTGEVLRGTGFKTIASAAPEYSYLDAIVDQMVRQEPEQRPSVDEVKKQLLAQGEQFVSRQRSTGLLRKLSPKKRWTILSFGLRLV
jgi:serine/threonine protein kinase